MKEEKERFALAVPDAPAQEQTSKEQPIQMPLKMLKNIVEAMDSLTAKVVEQDRYLRHIVQLLGLEEDELHG